ncbi:PAS domain S-box protein [bacterium]|nr:PAS domain S-box protein [bacterium]
MKSIELYSQLIDLTADGMYIYSMDGIILFANNGVSKLLEFDCNGEELIGKKMKDIIIYTQKVGVIRKQLSKAERIKSMKYRFKTLKGNDRCVLNNSILWKDETTGEQCVVCVVKDITSLESKTEELDSVTKQMDVTLSSIGEAVIATDVEGHIINMNHSAENITNASLVNVRGKLIYEIIQLMDDPEDLSSSKDFISEVINKKTLYGPIRMDAKVQNKDSFLKVIVNASPVINSSGKKMGVVISFRDISEVTKLEEQLRHSQKMESIGRLSGGLAHDFNNQLSIIRGCIDLIGMESNGFKKHSEYVDMAQDAIDQAEDVVSQLLTFSRQSNSTKEAIDLHKEISTVIKLMKHSFPPEITLLNKCEASQKIIYGNRNQIHNILVNIFVNARDSISKAGKIVIKSRNCHLSANDIHHMGIDLKSGNFIEIIIEDNGHGMVQNVLERIFDPFFTTKELGKGTGLGLAVVYGIIKEHNSDIRAFSEPGIGTKIIILLPVFSGLIEKANISKQPQEKKFSGKILLVDDEKSIRKIYSKLLRNIGFEVIIAENGLEAVQIFKELHKEIDIVLMDLMMPEMDGIEAFKNMKNITSDIKILFLTGYANSKKHSELMSLEVDIIYKPTRFKTMYSAIQKIMDSTQL